MADLIKGSINGLNKLISSLNTSIFNGNDITNLNTVDKTSILNAINELVSKYNNLAKTAGTGGGGEVTFEALVAAGDVGTAANQVSQGNHVHPYTIVEVVADYTTISRNTLIVCNAPVIITLPNIISSVNILINNNSNGIVTVLCHSSDTIEGDVELIIEFKNSTASLMSSLTSNNWFII